MNHQGSTIANAKATLGEEKRGKQVKTGSGGGEGGNGRVLGGCVGGGGTEELFA